MNENHLRVLLALLALVFGGGFLLAYREAPPQWRWVVILVMLFTFAGGCCIVPLIVGALHHH